MSISLLYIAMMLNKTNEKKIIKFKRKQREEIKREGKRIKKAESSNDKYMLSYV